MVFDVSAALLLETRLLSLLTDFSLQMQPFRNHSGKETGIPLKCNLTRKSVSIVMISPLAAMYPSYKTREYSSFCKNN